MRETSIGNLKAKLSAEIKIVESTKKPTRINNNGRPVAVLVSFDEWSRIANEAKAHRTREEAILRISGGEERLEEILKRSAEG